MICALFSFIGGLLSGEFYNKFPKLNFLTSAQNDKITKPVNEETKIIKANEFQVVDKDGKVCASLGLGAYKEYGADTDLLSPELRIFTPAYGSESGIIISASRKKSNIDLLGLSSGIKMSAYSLEEYGTSIIEVNSRPFPNIFKSKEPFYKKDDSKIILRSGCGSSTRMEINDSENINRAILGNVSLVQPKTGVETNIPASLVFFDKKGLSLWSAP